MSEVKTNKISSLASNNDITLDPDGTGKVSISGALHIDSGSDNANTLLLSDGAADNNIVDGFVTCRHHSSSEEPVHMIQGRATSSENIVLIGGTHNNTTYNTATSIKFFTAADSTTTTPSERMRIDNSGNIMMNTTSVGGTSILSLGSSNYMVATHNDGGTSGFFGQIRFRNNANNADVGTINRVNDASVQYNTTSDARLKENIADMTGAITRVKQLAPKRYSWINEELDAANQDGFLAHEAQAVVPIAVSGTQNEVDDEDNPVYMQMDYSKLVPLLTGALKEAVAKIEALEARVKTLEDA